MSFLLWRVALLLSALWMLPVLLIHAQPYAGIDLHTFLTPPENCPAPCFIGIRPGAMDVDEAVTILDEHAWVLWGDESPLAYQTPFQLNWQWSNAVPAWVYRDSLAFAAINRERIMSLYLRTRISRAEFLLAFGAPDKYRLLTLTQAAQYQYEAWYSDLGLRVLADGVCPGPRTTYDWPVMLLFQAEPPDFEGGSRPLLNHCR